MFACWQTSGHYSIFSNNSQKKTNKKNSPQRTQRFYLFLLTADYRINADFLATKRHKEEWATVGTESTEDVIIEKVDGGGDKGYNYGRMLWRLFFGSQR